MPDGSPTSFSIHKPEAAAVRMAWPSESRDFTPWLAENLDVLDALDIGRLELVDTEVTLPGTGRSLDLLAELPDGRRVAVENQFGRADHDHLTRGFAYAVGLAALPEGVAALVVIAEDHGSEFVAIADYFNRAAEGLGDDGIAVFLVRLSVERAEHLLIPRFEVLSRPNAWRSQVAETRWLSSVDEFLDRLQQPMRSQVEEIVSVWAGREGCELGHRAKNAIALYMPNPATKTGRTAMFVIFGDGTLSISVGYIRDSGLLDEGELVELESLVTRLFPDHGTGAKRYYFNSRTLDPDSITVLADWLAARSEVWRDRAAVD
jgi:hypothetical protein